MKIFDHSTHDKFKLPRNFYFLLMLYIGFFLKTPAAAAQASFYIFPTADFSLRAGPGYEYPITHPTIPLGAYIKIILVNNDKDWSEITTDDEKIGWIESKYLSKNKPPIAELQLAQRRNEVLDGENDRLRRQVNTLKTEQKNLSTMISSRKEESLAASAELAELRQISKNTMTIEKLNNELMEQKENLLAQVATLDSENVRLNEKLENRSFIQGTLAVLLGVIISIAIPKLVPGRRRKGGWV